MLLAENETKKKTMLGWLPPQGHFVNFGGGHVCISLFVYVSAWLCVFIAYFFGNFTFNHCADLVLFVLLRTFSIEAKSSFSFSGLYKTSR